MKYLATFPEESPKKMEEEILGERVLATRLTGEIVRALGH